MKKCMIGIIALLFSFLSVNLLFAATFTQADLTGTWRMNMLRTGFNNEWLRVRLAIDSSGVATCLSMIDSTGGIVACPGGFDLTLTMHPSTGVVTQTGYHAANIGTDHMTMASNKKFAAGTATYGDGSGYSYQMMIIQKEVAGTSYSADDLRNKSFVFHQLHVGAINEWRYGTGTIGAAGEVNITSQTNASTTPVLGAEGTLSVDISSGIVTRSADATFKGFLSDDKKTIVGTSTSGGGTSFKLQIMQITGQTYTAGPLSARTLSTHVLGTGVMPFWIHYANTVDSSGVMTFSDWLASNSLITPSETTLTGYIDASGKVTINGNPTFHGQVSHDGTFAVETQTGETESGFVYMLSVSTKVENTPSDFNNDGKPDLLWRNPTTGQNVVYYMDGITILSGVYLPTIDPAWTLAGIADLNNDGKPDLLWRNPATGQNVVYYMDGVTILSGVYLPTIDPAWTLAGIADLNNDGKPDLLWRNPATGENVVYYMDGITILSGVYLPTIDPAWTLAGTADLNNDGKPDLLWRNPATGENVVYYMDGITILSGVYLPTIDPAWTLAGTADLNNDGKPDLLWRNPATGENVVYYMDGITILSGVYLPTIDPAWTLAGH